MALGDAVSTLQILLFNCADFEPCFKVYNFVSVNPKSIKLCQMTTLNVTFHVEVSIYRVVRILNSPQFPAQFWNGQLAWNNYC